MAWLGGWFDPELEELFHDEPELLETAQLVRAARPAPEPDPRFRNRLRAQLVTEASRGRSARGVRRWWRLGPTHVAWGGAAVGAVLIGATVLTFVSNHPIDHDITAISDIAAQHSVNPNNVIEVRFNQPMDQQAVDRGVLIQPATEVSKSWVGNNLVITPVHHLSGNTPYTVTIAQSAIRAASGATASTPINISFATAPTPPASTRTPPALTPAVIGHEGTGSDGSGGSLLFAPDGSVVSTAGLLPSAAITTPTSSASPSPSPTATPEGVTSSPADAGQVVDYGANGTPSVLAAAATVAAFSPNGTTLAIAVNEGNGGSRISVIVNFGNGAQRSKLIDSSTPVTALTWSSNDRIVYTDGTSIGAVDLSGQATTLYTVAAGGTIASLDPGGAYAYLPPQSGNGGDLLDIATESEQVLQGSSDDVAFSGDGSTVVWADASTPQTHIWSEAVSENAPASVSVVDPSSTYSDIAVDGDGDEAAYLMADSSGSTRLVVVQLPSGTPLAIEPLTASPSELALSAGGDQVAFVANASDGTAPSVERATVPGATAAHTAAEIPAAANSTLHAFVEAQVRDDLVSLAALSGPTANAADSTPGNLSRAYLISTYLEPGDTVSASVELIVDPNAGHASVQVASETLTLVPDSAEQGYLVTAIISTPLRDEASGPHVVQVTSSIVAGVTTLEVSFDSDLNPGSVAGAVTVLAMDGTALPSTTIYDADSRTATVTVTNAPVGVLTLDISTALNDVDGQTLAHGFQTRVGTNS